MWATHGMPPQQKLERLTVEIAQAITAAIVELTQPPNRGG